MYAMSIDWLRKPNMDPVYYCNVIDLFYCAKRDFQQYFSYIMAISWTGTTMWRSQNIFNYSLELPSYRLKYKLTIVHESPGGSMS
jgi:FtsH-binding integral membrane protein